MRYKCKPAIMDNRLVGVIVVIVVVDAFVFIVLSITVIIGAIV